MPVETIFVDNGSVDRTAESVAAAFPDVVVLRRPVNEGQPARNHALRIARGRYRMFLDSDARLTANALPLLVEALDGSPTTGSVVPRLVYPDGRLQLSTRRYPPFMLPVLRFPYVASYFERRPIIRRHLMADDPHDRRRPVEYAINAANLFRAEAQEAVGELDKRIWFGHEDADWCFRIRRAGYTVEYVPEAVVVHHYQRAAAARPFSWHTFRFLLAHFYFQAKWLAHRRQLKRDGARMDQEAGEVAGRPVALADGRSPH